MCNSTNSTGLWVVNYRTYLRRNCIDFLRNTRIGWIYTSRGSWTLHVLELMGLTEKGSAIQDFEASVAMIGFLTL